MVFTTSVIGPEGNDNNGLINPTGAGGYENPYNFDSLVALVIPSSVTSLDNYDVHGFMDDCDGLVAVSIPNSVTFMAGDAFRFCDALTSIIIPRSVSNINANRYTFRGCTDLTTIIVDPNNATYDSRGGCNAIITKININENLPENTLIYGCNGTTIIPSTVTKIYDVAFVERSGLTSVIFENPNGWSYSSNRNMSSPTALSASNLANPSIAATYLTDTYCMKYWARSD